jgi:hypothetical protein
LKTRDNQLIGQGQIRNKLYLLDAKVELPGAEKANLAMISKATWNQWHKDMDISLCVKSGESSNNSIYEEYQLFRYNTIMY